MGCDIHMYVETKKPGSKKWIMVGKQFKYPYYNPEKENEIDEEGFEWNPQFVEEPYKGRNYDLFGILADVRNGRGFAGIKTGEGFNPISQPKGVPEDASDGYLKKVEDYESDGHSHSFFTIKELKEYDWAQYTMHRGMILFEEFMEMKAKGTTQPKYWCGDVSGSNVVKFEENQAELYAKDGKLPSEYDDKEVYVNYHWTELYSESVGKFLTETLPMLEKLGDPENVRIVFYFDN